MIDPNPNSVSLYADRIRWIVLAFLCVFCALVGRFCFAGRPFDSDGAMFIYMGKMVSEGGRLCHDLVDNKLPTVGLMTSIAWRAFGTSWVGYICLQTVLSFASAWMLADIAARHAGSYAFRPTLLYAVVLLNFTPVVFGGFQLETCQVFFTIIAARSALMGMESNNAGDLFLAGLAAGCAAMFKPTGLAILVPTVVVFAWHRSACKPPPRPSPGVPEEGERRRIADGLLVHKILAQLFSLALGVSIPLTFAFVYLWQTDLLRDMPALWRQISTYAADSAWATIDIIKPLLAILFLGFPIFVRGWICRHQRDAAIKGPLPYVKMFVLIWLMVEAIGILMQRRMYAYHFMPLIPPAALLFGLIPRRAKPISIAAALLPLAMLSIYCANDVITLGYSGYYRMPVSDYLASHAKFDDAVWIDDWPRLVIETNLRPASRYPFTFLFANYDTAGLDFAAGMISDFDRVKPKYLVLPTSVDARVRHQESLVAELARRPVAAQNFAEGWHRLEAYTLEHYDRETVIGGEVVYHRRSEGSVANLDQREITP